MESPVNVKNKIIVYNLSRFWKGAKDSQERVIMGEHEFHMNFECIC